MAYVGNSPTQQSFTGGVDQYNGNNSNTVFGLTRTINTVYDIDAYVENVWQRPTTGYTVSANTITFTSAPPAGSNNVVVVYRNFSATSIVPQQGSVTHTAFAANAIPTALGYMPANKAGDTFSGAVSGITTLAAGNTTITGTLSATANVNFDSGTFVVDGTNNRVGINKSAPVAPIHIYGTGTSGQSNAALIIENGSSGTLGIDITGTAGSSYARVRYGGGPSTGTNAMTGDVALIGLEGSSIGFQQIKFAPTQNASSDANTLDDYEEGTWTPTISNQGTATYNQQVGKYVKIGQQVTLWFHIDVATQGSASGVVSILSFPFTSVSSGSVYGASGYPHCQSWNGTRSGVHFLVPPGSTGADGYQDSGNGAAQVQWSTLGTGNILGMITYFTNS